MNLTESRSRPFYTVALTMIALTVAAACYIWGQPWIRYHQDNLVIYDCQLQASSFPVGAKYAGRIENVLVSVGQRVRAGDIVAAMDTSELTARIKRATAAIELAKAQVDAEQVAIEKSLATMAAQQNCLNAKRNVAARRSNAIRLETEWISKQLARHQKLAQRRSVSNAQLENVLREMQKFQSKAEIASEEDSIARLDLAALESKIEEIQARKTKLEVFQQQVNIAESELEIVREQQRAGTIRATKDGTVIDVFAGAGSSIKLGDPIVQIQSDNVWCEAWLDESSLRMAQTGSIATIHLKAFSNAKLQGTVVSILPNTMVRDRTPNESGNPVLQPDSKICLKIDIKEAEQLRLLPGLTGTAAIRKISPQNDSPELSVKSIAQR